VTEDETEDGIEDGTEEVADAWHWLRYPGLVHLLITARDEASAYRVFDALVERFPGLEPPSLRPAPDGLVAFSVLAPTLGPADR
jgi:hypothetical protein